MKHRAILTKGVLPFAEVKPGHAVPLAGGTPSAYRGSVDHYANAVRAELGQCWRMVSRRTGFRVDTPTDCLEPVRWIGRRLVGKKRMRLWSCEGHAEGLEDLRRVSRAAG